MSEPKLNTTRLHRVLRNLCYHAPTRNWVIRALLSILQRTSECKAEDDRSVACTPASTPTTPSSSSGFAAPAPSSKSSDKSKRKSSTTIVCGEILTPSKSNSDGSGRSTQPSWLSISLDAALGCRANIFQIQRGSGKKHSSAAHTVVSIHPQAAPIICRHVLDTLISLAKSFPCQFLPQTKTKEASCDGPNNKETTDSQKGSQTSPARSQSTGKADKSDSVSNTQSSSSSRGDRDLARGGSDTDFWELLVRLDSLSVSRKGKGFQRLHSLNGVDNDIGSQTFEASALGQLMTTLSHPVIRRSQLLTDRLLRLLGHVAVGLPDVTNSASTTSTDTSSSVTTTVATGISRGKSHFVNQSWICCRGVVRYVTKNSFTICCIVIVFGRCQNCMECFLSVNSCKESTLISWKQFKEI